jgi:hypothetical protein
MKAFFLSIAAVAVMGCGSLGSNGSRPTEKSEGKGKPPPPARTDEEPVSKAPDNGSKLLDVTGMWENSSCGERKYKRTINFVKEGRFNAMDEIAPCPPEKKCVWSGIVLWRGTWFLQDRSVKLDIEPLQTDKLPETMPEEFVVLTEEPVSVGEKSGDIICPYQKGK